MFFRRGRGGPDPHLDLKMLAFVVGAALALAGIAFEVAWLVTAAIVLMAAVMIGARILRAKRPPED
jgi:membrane protein implicated in regulation of membrane protease activity